jgi:ribosomal-protein-alanine N-acetyltransferase
MALNPDIETIAAFRPMVLEDVPRVMEIEVLSYRHPWTPGILRDCIRVGYSAFVYEIETTIQAYGLLSIAANEAHILNICVAPAYQGRGIGRKVLRKLLNEAHQKDVDKVFLEVRKSNKAAIGLYKQEGFNRVGIRRDYYPTEQGREDAWVFAREMSIVCDHE